MTFLDKIKYLPFFLLSMIPFKILYIFSDFIYVLMYYVVGYRKKVVRSNLHKAFPELNASERIRIEKKFYKHFCDVIVESMKLITISRNNLKHRFKILNPDLIDSFRGENKNFILYSGHIGNWEWFPAIPLYSELKIIGLYLPLRSAYFNHLIINIRQRFGMKLI